MLSQGSLSRHIVRVRAEIAEAAQRAGRRAEDVMLVAVTKGWPADVVRMAIDAGLTDIGENRVQEAEPKSAALSPGTRFHLVGHLQRNKARKAAALFDVIHSVDSPELGAALAAAARGAGRTLDVLVQVNIAGDTSKHGIRSEDAPGLLGALEPLQGIRVVGLMTIGPLVDEPEQSRPHFRALRRLRDRLMPVHSGLCHLSMGMSSDYAVAVEEGATIVRIGTALFGVRES